LISRNAPETRGGSSRRVWTYMAALVLIWGLTATVEAVSLRSLSPLQFTMWSTVFGAVGVLFLCSVERTLGNLFSYSAAEHARLFILAMLGYTGYFVLKYTAYVTSPVPQANVLQYTFTIFVVILAVPFLKQPLTLWKAIGVAVGFAGAAVVMTSGTMVRFEAAYLPGYCAALSAGFSFALFSVMFERTGFRRIFPLFYFHAYSAGVLFLVLVARGEFALPGGMAGVSGAIYSGFVSNVLGMHFWLTAQNISDDVSVLTGVLYLVPFVSLVCFRFFLDLPIPRHTYMGLSLIVGGMMIHIARRRLTREHP